MAIGKSAIKLMGVKPANISKRFINTWPLTMPACICNRVWPSAGDAAKACIDSRPTAPGRLSTITGFFSRGSMFLANILSSASAGPPGGTGTKIFNGLDGQASVASTHLGANSAAAAPPAERRTSRRVASNTVPPGIYAVERECCGSQPFLDSKPRPRQEKAAAGRLQISINVIFASYGTQLESV